MEEGVCFAGKFKIEDVRVERSTRKKEGRSVEGKREKRQRKKGRACCSESQKLKKGSVWLETGDQEGRIRGKGR